MPQPRDRPRIRPEGQGRRLGQRQLPLGPERCRRDLEVVGRDHQNLEVDGVEVLRRALPAGEGLGVKSVWREKWKLWETTYDEDVAVEVPAGEHRIRVENHGSDWIAVSRYVFAGCRTHPVPDIYAFGLRSEDVIAIWVQNRRSTWSRHSSGERIEPVPAFTLTIPEMAEGRYRVERWETWRGRPAGVQEISTTAGGLRIEFEPLTTDIALKIRPAR